MSMAIFNSYVSLPEGKLFVENIRFRWMAIGLLSCLIQIHRPISWWGFRPMRSTFAGGIDFDWLSSATVGNHLSLATWSIYHGWQLTLTSWLSLSINPSAFLSWIRYMSGWWWRTRTSTMASEMAFPIDAELALDTSWHCACHADVARRHGPELGALGALGPLGPLVMLQMVAVADIHWSWTTSKPADPGPSFMGLATRQMVGQVSFSHGVDRVDRGEKWVDICPMACTFPSRLKCNEWSNLLHPLKLHRGPGIWSARGRVWLMYCIKFV